MYLRCVHVLCIILCPCPESNYPNPCLVLKSIEISFYNSYLSSKGLCEATEALRMKSSMRVCKYHFVPSKKYLSYMKIVYVQVSLGMAIR